MTQMVFRPVYYVMSYFFKAKIWMKTQFAVSYIHTFYHKVKMWKTEGKKVFPLSKALQEGNLLQHERSYSQLTQVGDAHLNLSITCLYTHEE